MPQYPNLDLSRHDMRSMGHTSVGEIFETFRRAIHQGEQAYAADHKQTPGADREQRCLHAAQTMDACLMDNSLSPSVKFQAAAILMGYLSEAHGGWTRCHIPMQVVARGE